jgi:hypothetical protein
MKMYENVWKCVKMYVRMYVNGRHFLFAQLNSIVIPPPQRRSHSYGLDLQRCKNVNAADSIARF